mgnify:CR=1 FL=1
MKVYRDKAGEKEGVLMDILGKAKNLAKNAAAVTGEAAKTAAGKTKTAAKKARIHAKIRAEKSAIEACKTAVGEYFLGELATGMMEDPYLSEMGDKIKEHEAQIQEYEEAIEALEE